MVVGLLSGSSCKHEPVNASASKAVMKVALPYQVKDTTEWKMNEDPRNIILVMNALKAIENRDAMRFGSYFTDSLIARGDGYIFKGSRAEMNTTNKRGLASLKKVKIKVHNWQSVVNDSGSLAWVNVSYTQYKDDHKGKRDSTYLYNEGRDKNGMTEESNEYFRNVPRP